MAKRLLMTIADVGYIHPDFQVVGVTAVNCRLPSAGALLALKHQALARVSPQGIIYEGEFNSESGGYRITIEKAGVRKNVGKEGSSVSLNAGV